MAGAVRRPLSAEERSALEKATRLYKKAREAYDREREALHSLMRQILAAQAAPSQILSITGYTSSQLYQIRDASPNGGSGS